MNPKMIWSNLAVSDLERTTRFYTDLGFKSNGSSKELTSFFVGEKVDFTQFYRQLIFGSDLVEERVASNSSGD